MKRQAMFVMVVIGCVTGCFGVYHVSLAEPPIRSGPEVHPKLIRFHDMDFADAEGRTFYLDGYRLPFTFEVSTLVRHPGRTEDVGESGRLKFVLIVPDTVTVPFTPQGTVPLAVNRPVYICTTTLSQRHVANLVHGMERLSEEDTYRQYRHVFDAHILQGYPEDVEVPAVTAYLDNPNLPAIIPGPALGRFYADRLSIATGLDARMPTLGEWYLATRGGRATQYWWGDEWDASKVVRPVGPNPPEGKFDYLGAVSPVDSGERNPLGLYHSLGNVFQVVEPSDVEVEAIRVAIDSLEGQRVIVPGGMRKRTSLLVGGSVVTSERMIAREAVDLPSILGGLYGGQYTAAWLAPRDLGASNYFYMVGVRPVLEVSKGRVEIRDGGGPGVTTD